MYGIDADGWLAVHHVAHRELMERAERSAQRASRKKQQRSAPTVVAPVPVSTAPVCC